MLIGIVGKTNVGKSTFFKALTLEDVEISNRTFVTIKPNQGVGFVTMPCACKKHDVVCNPKNSKCRNGVRFIPVKLLDVAGLVPGAHEGKGLGNKFLDDLRQAESFIHIVDISGSTNEIGEAVTAGVYDPEKDISFLPEEIDMWFFGILKKNWAKIVKDVVHIKKNFEEEVGKQLSGLNIREEEIKSAMRELKLEKGPDKWSDSELMEFSKILREGSKKMVIAGNKSDLASGKKNYERLKSRFDIIPCSAEYELALREADKKGLIEYIPGEKEFLLKGIPNEKQKKALDVIEKFLIEFKSTGVQECLNKLVFDVLGYIIAYPVANIGRLSDKQGNILPDAFLIKKGTKLKEFASMIHTNIGENFIGGLDIGKKKIGADYELKNGDAVEILVKK